MFECKKCQQLEARIDKLMADAHEERKLTREAAERERAQWAKERTELLTRIQAWAPSEGDRANPSQRDVPADEADETAELLQLGLVPNSDGGYIDVRLNPPIVWDTVEDCKAVRAFFRRRGLPENTNPTIALDEGFDALVLQAKKEQIKVEEKQEVANGT